ncbi:CoA transferase [Algimonas arctica]|uniref:CoA transferase n=1 Tax=Algimonas arctica TaxID=1479486 RepID=A0A8J3CUQ5_9PROT|nr:CoA transferase [Algimonas arctica]GHB02715.1 CoA transferase [Algimonas arctica]
MTDPLNSMRAHLPLDGIRVVELSTMITASFAAMILAEQGADVIKVEPPGMGDPMRFIGSQKPGLSALFHNCNRGKRSIVLDLKDGADLSVARTLCERADVVISNYRPSVMARIGLSYEALKAVNPKIVFCRITGFGTDGPQAALPAYDHVMQAQLGMTAAQGKAQNKSNGGQPFHIQHAICDKATGLMAAQAVSSALFASERSGQGSRVDLSMIDAGMHFFFPDGLMEHTLLDDAATQLDPLTATYAVMEARDGYFVIAGIGDAQATAVFTLIGKAHLMSDPRFKTPAARLMNIGDMVAEMTATSVDQPIADVLAYMEAHDVPCCECLSPLQAYDHPQLAAMKTVATVDHPYLGKVRSVRAAARFEGQDGVSHAPSPVLGQHGTDIRAELEN